MGTMVSQITSRTIIYSTVYSGADQWKHQSSASLAFVQRIHRWPVNSPHKWPVTLKLFPSDDVIMCLVSSRYEIGFLLMAEQGVSQLDLLLQMKHLLPLAKSLLGYWQTSTMMYVPSLYNVITPYVISRLHCNLTFDMWALCQRYFSALIGVSWHCSWYFYETICNIPCFIVSYPSHSLLKTIRYYRLDTRLIIA